MNQLCVYVSALHLGLPHPTPLGHHRALSWAPGAIRPLSTGYFTHSSVYMSRCFCPLDKDTLWDGKSNCCPINTLCRVLHLGNYTSCPPSSIESPLSTRYFLTPSLWELFPPSRIEQIPIWDISFLYLKVVSHCLLTLSAPQLLFSKVRMLDWM